MRRALHIHDLVCIREESLAAVQRTYPQAELHTKYEISEDSVMMGRRQLFLLMDMSGEPVAQCWPGEVKLWKYDHRFQVRVAKFRAQLDAEVQAARKARARRCPRGKKKA